MSDKILRKPGKVLHTLKGNSKGLIKKTLYAILLRIIRAFNMIEHNVMYYYTIFDATSYDLLCGYSISHFILYTNNLTYNH